MHALIKFAPRRFLPLEETSASAGYFPNIFGRIARPKYCWLEAPPIFNKLIPIIGDKFVLSFIFLQPLFVEWWP